MGQAAPPAELLAEAEDEILVALGEAAGDDTLLEEETLRTVLDETFEEEMLAATVEAELDNTVLKVGGEAELSSLVGPGLEGREY